MRNDGRKRAVLAVALVAMLTNCAETPPQTAANPPTPRRVSPTAVEPPVLPPGSFDQAKEQILLAQARASREAGDHAEARRLTESAIDSWPGDSEAWKALDTDCKALNDQQCRKYAQFFLAKLDYVEGLPAKAAVLGFQSLTEEADEKPAGGAEHDQKTIAMSRRLWAFYAAEDPMKVKLAQAPEETFSEKYPYVPMLLVGGIVGGALTIAKSVASK